MNGKHSANIGYKNKKFIIALKEIFEESHFKNKKVRWFLWFFEMTRWLSICSPCRIRRFIWFSIWIWFRLISKRSKTWTHSNANTEATTTCSPPPNSCTPPKDSTETKRRMHPLSKKRSELFRNWMIRCKMNKLRRRMERWNLKLGRKGQGTSSCISRKSRRSISLFWIFD